MLEASEARELIDEAVERAEEDQKAEARAERAFRDKVSLMVGIFAVVLAVIHVVGAGLVRENIVDTIRASDTYNYMQAKRLRQEVLKLGALTAPADQRAGLAKAADDIAKPDSKGHGLGQLQEAADKLAEDGAKAGEAGERYEWAETALQMAIVLLSIAIIANSRAVVLGASALALAGTMLALATHWHWLG